jgi:Integrase
MTDSKKEFLLKASAPSDAEVLEFIASCPDECLQFRNDDGSISLDGVKEYMRKARKNKILDNYRGQIKKLNGKDQRYYIKLKDSSRSDGRYTIKAPTEEELLEKVFLWHLENVEKIKEPTLASIFPEFLEYKKKTTWSESTAKRNLSVWKNHYENTDIIHVPIRKIRLKILQEWAYGLIEKHDLTQKEFGNVATWMKQMFEYAAMEEIIDRNPYTMLKITNRNVFRQPEIKSDEHKVLSPDMELALYRKCWEHFESRYYPVHQLLPLGIIMLFQAGLRPSELATLRYSDIDGDEIIIRRYYSDKANVIRENRTKAGHGFRRIILTSLAKEIIEAARQRQLEEGIENPEYIFMMNDRFKSFYDRLRKTFPVICKSIGIPQNTPYSGRRTFISSLIDANVNIRTIQNYVGHNDARTTLNNYCYDRSAREERARQLESARVQISFTGAA